MTKSRCTPISALATGMRPPLGSAANVLMTRSISVVSCTAWMNTSTPKERPAASNHRQESMRTWGRRVVDGGDTRHGWCDLLEQLQPFRANRKLEQCEPGDIASRMGKAGDEAGTDGIGDLREDDRYCAGRPLHWRQGGARSREDHIRLRCHEFGRIGARPDVISAGPAIVDLEVAAFAPSQLLQSLPERTGAGLSFRVGFESTQQHPDPSHRNRWLLCARRDRPCDRRAAECG